MDEEESKGGVWRTKGAIAEKRNVHGEGGVFVIEVIEIVKMAVEA